MLFNSIKFLTTAGVLTALVSCNNNQAKAPQYGAQAVAVTVGQVESGDATYHDEFPGILVALNQTELRPQVTGYIKGIYFKDGDKVKQGQRLYTIDQQLYEANYQEAVAAQQVQETNLMKMQQDVARYRALDKKNAIAKQQVDYAEAALAAAEKQVAAAKAKVNAVQANVGFSTILAPFSGTIGISQVRMGTSVVAGQTILNTVSTDDPIAVDIVLDQAQLYRFSQMHAAGAKQHDSTFSLMFGEELYPYFGKISLIDRAVDPQTGTIKVRLSFPNKDHVLKAGMNATVRVKGATESTLMIPFKSVTEQLGDYFVYVVGDSSRVSQRKIKKGRQIGGDIIVNDGLQQGETIVIQGIQNLREGASIKIDSSTTK